MYDGDFVLVLVDGLANYEGHNLAKPTGKSSEYIVNFFKMSLNGLSLVYETDGRL